MEGRWNYPNFDLYNWDEYGANLLTVEVKNMIFGLVPWDEDAVYMLAHDAEFCHVVINNLRRRLLKNRIKNMFTRNKGEK